MSRVLEPETVMIEQGPVILGEPEFPADAGLPHAWVRKEVHVRPFAIARYAVTLQEYIAFAEVTGYPADNRILTDPRFQDPSQPVAFVSWIDATRYVQWLARVTGKPYRLLRDAEFEKAARGGLFGKKYPWGDAPPEGRCDFNNPPGAPLPTGSFPPNGYGLYDMAGSMWSWCEECFNEVAFPDQARMNYEDTQVKDVRLNPICRGGSFKTVNPSALYCAHRHEDPIDGRFDCIGFRVGLSVS